MANSKPVIVISPGAWHRPIHYEPLSTALEAQGYEVIVPALPSVDGSMDTFAEDVHTLRSATESALNENKDVVLVMHSYGGICGSAAVKGLEKTASTKAGVTHLVYMTAFAIPEGATLLQMCGGKPLDWWDGVNEKQWCAKSQAQNICYNDVDPALVPSLIEQCGLQAKGCMTSPQTYAAWKHIDSTYVVCEIDNAIPVAAQEGMAAQEGNRFVSVERVHAGHSPWISKTAEVVAIVRKAAGEKL